jgi:hypothetical protein
MQGKERPLGVTIIGVLLFLLGLIMILGGLALFALGDLVDVEALAVATGAVSVVIGIVYIVLAFGFLKGWNWVWVLTMVVLIIGILWSILQWVLNGMETDQIVSMLLGLIIPIIIVLYMNSKKVKAFFGKA